MTHTLHLYDRSRVGQDWKCPRARYWQYEHAGRGIVKHTTSLELYLGTTVHDALAAIATLTKAGLPVDIDEIALAAAGQMRLNMEPEPGEVEDMEWVDEQAALVEGLIRGFYRAVWPRLLEEYPDILFVEEEMQYEHDGLLFMSKPDLVLGNGSDIIYFEYKTTSSKKESWINSWDTAVQLHSTARAIKATKGVDVTAVVVQGLYKGYESYGKQSSPFCYAYKKYGNPPFSEDQIAYEFRSGFKRSPTWQLEGGVKGWVEAMPEEVLAAQFPQTLPIYYNEDLVESFFRQRAERETEIANFHKPNVGHDLDRVFPQRFDQCQPSFGWPCPYRIICHGGVTDPLDEGFTYRESHHALEAERHASVDSL